MSGMMTNSAGVLEKAGWKWCQISRGGGYWVHPATGKIKGEFPSNGSGPLQFKIDCAESILSGAYDWANS